MSQKKLKAWLLITLVVLNDIVTATHHWKLSKDGTKIEAVQHSPYSFAYPSNLVAFLRHVKNVKELTRNNSELQKVMKLIHQREHHDDPNFEDVFKSKDQACVKSNSLDLEYGEYTTSYSVEICPEYHKAYERYLEFVREHFGDKLKESPTKPRCLGYTDEQRPIDKDGKHPPDPTYMKILEGYFPNFNFDHQNIHLFGGILSTILGSTSGYINSNPYSLMAIAAYWRAQGYVTPALECYRAALSAISLQDRKGDVPQFEKDGINLALAVLVTKSKIQDMSMVFKEVLKNQHFSPCQKAMVYAASGDSEMIPLGAREIDDTYAMREYQKAIKELSTLAKDSTFLTNILDGIEKKESRLVCRFRLLDALTNQLANLKDLLAEKQRYNVLFTKRIELESKIGSMLEPVEMRRTKRFYLESKKYGNSFYRKCTKAAFNKFLTTKNIPMNMAKIMICDVLDEVAYAEELLPKRQATLKAIKSNNSTWKTAEMFGRNKIYEKKLENIGKTLNTMNPPNAAKFSKSTIGPIDRPWRRVDWPNSVDCQAVISTSDPFRLKNFPEIFISPDNLGWSVSEMLTDTLGLAPMDELPQPWLEPVCDVDNNVLKKLNGENADLLRKFMTIDLKRNETLAETSLKTVFVRLTGRVLQETEVAARIWTLMNYKIGPQWIAQNLAALYWRTQGDVTRAVRCLVAAYLGNEQNPIVAATQLTQIGLRIWKSAVFFSDKRELDRVEPMYLYVTGRVKMFIHHVEEAVQDFKNSLDLEYNQIVFDDLLKITCSGKSPRSTISLKFPTVCCSTTTQEAVCVRQNPSAAEHCYVVDPTAASPHLVYHRCNGQYKGVSTKTSDYVGIVSPFLSILNSVSRRDHMSRLVGVEGDGVQTVMDTNELPLDYGGTKLFFAKPAAEWWQFAKSEQRYTLPKVADTRDEWEEEITQSDLAEIPQKPLSFLWINDKKDMLSFDVKLPSSLPEPPIHMIRKGVAVFPPPKKTGKSCVNVAKLDLFDTIVPTWVSVTAKGEDIEKYVDLHGPVPAIAKMQPVCPTEDKYETSSILGMSHIPAFALSDQFLFYQPEKALEKSLKSLGNERDSIEHVAARLHVALTTNLASKKDVSWLLCVLSSLYWRVNGDSENAMNCLKCALHTAPPNMRDIVLVSLANMCHQTGLLHSALITASAALSVTPKMVSIHLTLANIYASIGDYNRALKFYYSTLSIQSNFQPAKDRIKAIYCHTTEEYEF